MSARKARRRPKKTTEPASHALRKRLRRIADELNTTIADMQDAGEPEKLTEYLLRDVWGPLWAIVVESGDEQPEGSIPRVEAEEWAGE